MKKFFPAVMTAALVIISSAAYIHAGNDPHYTNGEQLFKEGKIDRALEEYRLAYSSPDKDVKKTAAVRIGYIFFLKNNYSEAVRYYGEALNIDPGYREAWEMQGLLYLGPLNDTGRALYSLLKAEELGSTDPAVYYNIACCYSLENNSGKAFVYLDRAIFLGYRKVDIIKSDRDLAGLSGDERFKKLVSGFAGVTEADELLKKGDSSYSSRDFVQAAKYYVKALELYGAALWHPSLTLAQTCTRAGDAYLNLKSYGDAVTYYDLALKENRDLYGRNHKKTASSCTSLAIACEKNGNYSRALELYNESLDIRLGLSEKNTIGLYVIYSGLGRICSMQCDYGRSLEYREKALAIQVSVFGEYLAFTDYNNIGETCRSQGDFDRALSYFEKALAIAVKKSGEKSGDTALCYNNMGAAYEDKSDYDRAVSYYMKALDIILALHGEKHRETAMCYNNIGVLYQDRGDYERALEYHAKALEIQMAVVGENDPDTAATCNNTGRAYSLMKDYDRAAEYYERSLRITLAVTGEKHADTAVVYNNLGVAYLAKGDYDRALAAHLKALEIRRAVLGEKHPDTAQSCNNTGWLYRKKRDYARAAEYLSNAVSVIKNCSSDRRTVIYLQNLGCVYADMKKYRESLEQLYAAVGAVEKFRSLNISGGADFTSRNINAYYYTEHICMLMKDMEGMFNISERMRATGSLERLSIRGAVDSAGIDPGQGRRLIELRDNIERLSMERQNLVSMPDSLMSEQQKKERYRRVVDITGQIAAAEEEFGRLDTEFMKNSRYRAMRSTSVVTVKRAQELCGIDGAVIEYIIPDRPDEYVRPYAMIITGSSVNAVELDPAYNYSVQVEKYRKAIRENDRPAIDTIGAELFAKLLLPVSSCVSDGSIKKLIIVPDGSLAFMPFDSLKTTDGKYLSEMYRLVLTPSVTVSVMIGDRRYGKRDNLLAFGGGKYSSAGESVSRGEVSFRGIEVEPEGKERIAATSFSNPLEYYRAQQIGWADLPGTGREVLAINEKIYNKKNTEIYTGEKVSEQNMKSLSKRGELKKFSSIHLACHGYYDPEYPSYSAVVFSEVSGKLKESRDDGYMSVDETALLDLQSEIVVLSACETGLGRMVSGNGVIGLTRAFQVAGSNRVLVTLWPVSDEATEQFMVSFYAKIRQGTGYSEALVKVKEEFRKTENYSAPYYWAGFVLYE